jgi:hypothetical protein
VARVAGVIAVAVLTGTAIGWFSISLETSLRESAVPEAVAQELLADASRLAELQPPDDLAADVKRKITVAVATSYVDAFRLMAVICGLLAIGSGLVAWYSLDELHLPRGRT